MTLSMDIASHLKEFVFHEQAGILSSATPKRETRVERVDTAGKNYHRFINEFWTAKQKQASSLHQISYRACFKPQLPRFFIERLSNEGDIVYDPFAGRGTTIIEAALLGRHVVGNDINPLSRILTLPRLTIPSLSHLEQRLYSIRIDEKASSDRDLTMFYHRKTLREILSLRNYLHTRSTSGQEDALDAWIRMVATNRLTGHSPGFFSVYTLPPNQAVSQHAQRKINRKRKQKPEYRDTREIILRKSRLMISDLLPMEIWNLAKAGDQARFFTKDARSIPEITDNSVQLTVTSPPFLDVVQYSKDNWLRCWFNNIDTDEVARQITKARTVELWSQVMEQIFVELHRITRPGGWIAFEVGEVRSGSIRLDEHVVPLGVKAGLKCEAVLINKQKFTKTANIWGIKNNTKGTNTNRVVIFQKQ